MDNFLKNLLRPKKEDFIKLDINRIRLINQKIDAIANPLAPKPKDNFFVRLYNRIKQFFTAKKTITISNAPINRFGPIKPINDKTIQHRERIFELIHYEPKQSTTFDDEYNNAELLKSITEGTGKGCAPKHVDFEVIDEHNWLNKDATDKEPLGVVIRSDFNRTRDDMDYQHRKMHMPEKPFAVVHKKTQVKSNIEEINEKNLDSE